MNQRRILIGAMIGILSFTILTWISTSTWAALEDQLLQGRSALRFFSPFKNSNYTVFEFDADNKLNFQEKTSLEQKEILLNLVTELSAKGASTIDLVINKENPFSIEDIDLEMAGGDFGINLQTISINDISTRKKNDKGDTLLLDRGSNDIQFHSVTELISDVLERNAYEGKNVLLISPRADIEQERINLLVNYLEDNWISFVRIPAIMMFPLLIVAGVLLAAFIYWARIVAFFTITASVIIFGQLVFTIFNIDIETIPLLIALTGILLLSNLFDLNLAAINSKNIFKSQEEPETSTVSLSTPFIKVGKEGDLSSHNLTEMRSKFFMDQESNLEEIALEFQEKTVKSINAVTEKLEELLESNNMSDRDKIKLSLVKHNFDHMIEEVDAILFNLVPFRFEGEKGLINLLELYANKLFLLSRGKLQLSIQTEFPVIKLEHQQRINAYRILHRLVQLITEANQDEIKSGLNIGISILADKDARMKFKISYEGMPIDANNGGFKLKEVHRRVDSLDGELDLGQDGLSTFASKLTNHIEFKMSNPKGSVLLAR